MTAFNVDAAQVAAASVSAAQTADAIRSSVAAMMAQLTGLEASWGGAASANFQGVIAQWQATQVQVEAALESVGMALGHASSTYTEAETSAASLFAG